VRSLSESLVGRDYAAGYEENLVRKKQLLEWIFSFIRSPKQGFNIDKYEILKEFLNKKFIDGSNISSIDELRGILKKMKGWVPIGAKIDEILEKQNQDQIRKKRRIKKDIFEWIRGIRDLKKLKMFQNTDVFNYSMPRLIERFSWYEGKDHFKTVFDDPEIQALLRCCIEEEKTREMLERLMFHKFTESIISLIKNGERARAEKQIELLIKVKDDSFDIKDKEMDWAKRRFPGFKDAVR